MNVLIYVVLTVLSMNTSSHALCMSFYLFINTLTAAYQLLAFGTLLPSDLDPSTYLEKLQLFTSKEY